MRKQILAVGTICCVLMFSACSGKSSEDSNKNKNDNAIDNTIESNSANEDKDVKNDENGKEDKNEAADGTKVTLNKASGDMSNYIEAIDNYFESVDTTSAKDEKLIAAPVIYYVDKTDEANIKLYGNFYIEHYAISDNQLITRGGETKQGVCHISKQNGGYTVTKLEEAEDGSYYAESISKFISDVKADLKPSLGELYSDNEIASKALEYTKNVLLYRYVAENGLDTSTYTDSSQNVVNFIKIRNIKYNGEIYTEIGQTSYNNSNNNEVIEIDNVVSDINKCQEENASDFGKCSIKAGTDGQILLKSDDGYRIFEK